MSRPAHFFAPGAIERVEARQRAELRRWLHRAVRIAAWTAGFAFVAGLATAVRAESWSGQDKELHFAGGAAVSSAVTAATGSESAGLMAGVGVGIAKELADAASRRGTPSWKDAIATALGAYVGTKTTGLLIGPRHITVRIRF